MIAQSIDPAMATVIAAVVALVGTFIANTYTTVVQGRQKIKEQQRVVAEQQMKVHQIYQVIITEMGWIVKSLMLVSRNPYNSADDFKADIESDIYNTSYKQVRDDYSLFFSIPGAPDIDRFYNWMNRMLKYLAGVQFPPDFMAKEELERCIYDVEDDILNIYIYNGVRSLDLSVRADLYKEVRSLFTREGWSEEDIDRQLDLVKIPFFE